VLFCAPFFAMDPCPVRATRDCAASPKEERLARRPPERRFLVLFLRYWLPVLAYVTLIAYLSAQPNLKPPIRFENSDKVYHVLEYLVLGVLLARALRANLRNREPAYAAIVALGLGILIGTGDEYLQSFIPGRESSALDLLADSAGLVVAQFLFAWILRE